MGSRITTMGKLVSVACLVASVSAFPRPQAPGPGGPGGIAFPKPGADGAYAGDNYFQYINVPAPHTFEWGYRRGNDGNEQPIERRVKRDVPSPYAPPAPAYLEP